MIEAVIDFDELQKDRRYIDEWHNYCPKEIEHKLYSYLSEKLSLPLRIGPDAFADFFWFLRFKEWKDYSEEEWEQYKDKDEWESYSEYIEEKEENSRYGLKNKQGVRDDLKLIFLNFNAFKKKYSDLAKQLLDVIKFTLSETAKYPDYDDLLDIQIEIRS